MSTRGGTWCAVYQCSSNTKRKTVSLFSFPKDFERCKSWIVNIGREDLLSVDYKRLYHMKVCAKHFQENMFLNDLKNRLQPHAVPSTLRPVAVQVGECSVSNTLLENAFYVEEEECQNEDFADNKLDISETAITGNPELRHHDKMEFYDISTTLDNVKVEVLSSEVHYNMIHDNLKIEEGSPK